MVNAFLERHGAGPIPKNHQDRLDLIFNSAALNSIYADYKEFLLLSRDARYERVMTSNDLLDAIACHDSIRRFLEPLI